MKVNLYRNLDIILACMGCILAVPVSIYLYKEFGLPFVSIGVIVFAACLFYLLARRGKIPSIRSALLTKPPSHLSLILNILFFGLLGYSIATYCLRPEIYVRPLGYFIATTIMVAVLAIEILFLSSRKSAIGFILFKAIAISLSLVWTQSLLYPSVIGVDPWYHQWLASRIVSDGVIPANVPYSTIPVMHLIVSGVMRTGLDYKMASLLSISLIQVVCNPILIYLLGKYLHGAKVGLMAALILAVANWHILFSFWIVPNSLGIAFIPIIIYLLFKVRQEHPKLGICLAIFFMGILIMTHTIAVVMLAVCLFFICLGFVVYKVLSKQPIPEARIFLFTIIGVATVSLSYWMFVSGDIHTLANLVRTGFGGGGFSDFGVIPPGTSIPSGAYYQGGIPFGEWLFDQLGLLLFCAVAFIGTFVAFSKKMITKRVFAFVFVGLSILAIAFIGFATQRFIIVGRWCYLSQILLSVPVGVALIWLASLANKQILKACLIGTATLGLAFVMIMSPQANQDNRILSPNTIVRSAFTESELEAINTVADEWEGAIAVDPGYYNMRRYFDKRLIDMSPQLISGNFSECKDVVVLIREEIITEPCRLGKYSPVRLTYDPREALVEQGFEVVCENGSVWGFAYAPI